MTCRVPLYIIALSGFLCPLSAQDSLSEIEKSASALVEAFNSGDAERMADLFVEAGELVLTTGEMVVGKEAIQEHYESLFSEPERSQLALEVGSVRLLTDGVAMEDGTVHFTDSSGRVSSFFYEAVHAKQADDSWKLASVRDVEGDRSLVSEKLAALNWLIGDWIMQTKGGDTWISFSWSGDGPYIDAKAVTESPEALTTGATIRIGWDENGNGFKSWSFDAEGGFNQSDWVEVNPDEYLLKTTGFTASGERNAVTQILKRNEDGEGFLWSKRDQVIGDEVFEDSTVMAVRRPPETEKTVAKAN
ncbi:MAG: SgcJ/EcaC family oxidoreductase [Verrucomicrobiales bacterium]|nr:SgcJ/EcaC family oxidoreductase [Verrucomicrobiales bacterium]